MVQSNQVPVGSGSDGELRIRYDGQTGNRQQLAYTSGLRDGLFEEERLLLHLYKQHGSTMVQHRVSLDKLRMTCFVSSSGSFLMPSTILC